MIIITPIWIVLNFFRRQPFSAKVNTETELLVMPKTTPKRSEFTLLTANLCLINEIASRANNLSHITTRARIIAEKLANERRVHTKVLTGTKISKIDGGERDRRNSENAPCCLSTDSGHSEGTSSTPMMKGPGVLPTIELKFPPHIDVILFQEVFHRKSAAKLREGLRNDFPYIVCDVGQRFGGALDRTRAFMSLENSGLFIASKYPIIDAQFKQFKKSSFSDKLAEKGVLLTTIQYSASKTGLIVNTHMQSLNLPKACQLRRQQFTFIHEEISKMDTKPAFTIFGGDFNCGPHTHQLEAEAFYEEYSSFADAHQSLPLPTYVLQERMHEIQSSEDLQRLLRGSAEWTEFLGTKEGVSSEILEDAPKEALQLDHILFSRDGLRLLRSEYHTGLCGLTDHVPLSATFKVV